MKRSFVIIFLVLVFPSFALGSSPSQRGATVFAESGCEHCHSIHNIGGHKGPDLSGVGRRKSKDAIRQQIVSGSKVMPAFGNILNDGEVNDLVAYLRSCRDKPRK
jgi:mono/diheme cytochrome c family protein